MSKRRWSLRVAVAGDAAALSQLAESTFRETFAEDNTPENMDDHCSASYRPDVQAGEIADEAMETLVAEGHSGELVAYAQLHRTHQPSCLERPGMMELQRLYVDQQWHGSGLAQEMMDALVERAMAEGADSLWLGVWERNPRAIRFYERVGFVAEGAHEFLLGTEPQRDLVMVLPLGQYTHRSLLNSASSLGGGK